MRTTVIKRSIIIGGHKTSFSLENEFFIEFKRIAKERNLTLSELAGKIENAKAGVGNLSSAIRVFVLNDALKRVHGGQNAKLVSVHPTVPLVPV